MNSVSSLLELDNQVNGIVEIANNFNDDIETLSGHARVQTQAVCFQSPGY